MNWVAPAAWLPGVAAVAAIVAAHLLSRRRPETRALPTARFVPERPLRVASRGIALSDALLLLARAFAIIALAAAFAGPLLRGGRRGIARVVAVDRSRAVADPREAVDSAHALLGPDASPTALVLFDSAAHPVDAAMLDSVRGRGSTAGGARGSLSAAIVVALREGARLAGGSDSVELAIVSPFAAEELDAATSGLRAGWPGRVRLVRVAAASADTTGRPLELGGSTDDPVAAGLRLAGAASRGATVRVRRGDPSPDDSAWARGRGRVLVHWPAAADGPDSPTPAGWRARARVDTIGAVVADDASVVAPFARRWTVDGAGEILARFADGEPAIADRATDEGCIRDVAIPIEPASDLPLRPEFRLIAAAVALPCGGAGYTGARADPATLARLAGSGPFASAPSLGAPGDGRSPWTPPLLALALLLLAAEWWMRRDRRGGVEGA